jgi:hypothetical protein
LLQTFAIMGKTINQYELRARMWWSGVMGLKALIFCPATRHRCGQGLPCWQRFPRARASGGKAIALTN